MSFFKIWMKLGRNNSEAEAQGSFAQSAKEPVLQNVVEISYLIDLA